MPGGCSAIGLCSEQANHHTAIRQPCVSGHARLRCRGVLAASCVGGFAREPLATASVSSLPLQTGSQRLCGRGVLNLQHRRQPGSVCVPHHGVQRSGEPSKAPQPGAIGHPGAWHHSLHCCPVWPQVGVKHRLHPLRDCCRHSGIVLSCRSGSRGSCGRAAGGDGSIWLHHAFHVSRLAAYTASHAGADRDAPFETAAHRARLCGERHTHTST